MEHFIEKSLLRAINRCSIYQVKEDNSFLYERGDSIILHWIPGLKKLYLHEGIYDSIKAKYKDVNDFELKYTLLSKIKDVYGFNLDTLEYMNDDFRKA